MTGVTLIIMGVMVSNIYKKNYVICRNPIYSSKYTLAETSILQLQQKPWKSAQ